jgi:hypothetical protein
MSAGAPPRAWASDASGVTGRERETAADKRLYVEIGLVPVLCQACNVEVAVKKNSRRHTSVQWNATAMAGCLELAEGPSGQETVALRLGCGRLKESIDAAVRDGVITVPDG